MHDDLVGFLTGALDASEHNEIQKRLDDSPELREQLAKIERCLSPLSWDKEDRIPPVGLAERTCTFVEDHIEENKVELASARKERIEALAAESSGWSFSDFVVAAGICLAAACLFFPAVLNSRYNARLAQCQNNMRQLGVAFHQYSDSNNGYFPAVPAKGKLAFAGSYAAMLREKDLINANMSNVFNCPSRGKTVVIRIPRVQEINKANGPQLVMLQKNMGGDYAYSLGFMEDGKLRGIKNLGRSRFVILADSPVGNLPRRNRGVHGRGQNVLFEDGHAAFLATSLRPGTKNDDFFLNDDGIVAAGCHSEDSVLAASPTPPLVFVGN